MRISKINPATLYDGAPFGMSQAAIDHDNGLIFISGQVDWNTDYQVNNPTLAAQTEGAVNKLLTVLAEAHASVDDVLQLRVYVRGELDDHMAVIVPILHKHFGQARPAVTAIGVASLASRETLIEIEAVAKVRG